MCENENQFLGKRHNIDLSGFISVICKFSALVWTVVKARLKMKS